MLGEDEGELAEGVTAEFIVEAGAFAEFTELFFAHEVSLSWFGCFSGVC